MRDELTQFQSMFSDPNTASASKIWDEVREKMCRVLWHELLWLPLHIPKHAVVTWMVILGRIGTKDKLVQLGIINDGQCKIDKGNYSGLLGASRKNVIKDNLRGSREMRVRYLEFNKGISDKVNVVNFQLYQECSEVLMQQNS
ncbi:hypothetical protein Goklo_020874 [Gossypium klotzschianum]|uniref:Reverse transcriptase zinc-binding domain-containing protein n=1 Tax=Gossypium klotzschianum TaxID=34286 RepID=A0A7J8UTH6_9ROSI|nr:hypothetical protein [Gossypium klotzschianum]